MTDIFASEDGDCGSAATLAHSSGLYAKHAQAIVRGQGALLWDVEGREYIDCMSGHGSWVARFHLRRQPFGMRRRAGSLAGDGARPAPATSC